MVDSFGTKTIDYNRVFASDPVYREFHNASGSGQQPFVYAEKRDPNAERVMLKAEKVEYGDFTVVKKTYDVNGKVDAVIDAEVKAAARFVVVDDSVNAQNNYVQAAKQSDGSYKYVSSDRYSNTASKDPATVMQLDANGKLKVTNLPLGRTYRVIEFATGAHYKLDMSDTSSRSVSVRIDESNKSQTKEMPNYEQYNEDRGTRQPEYSSREKLTAAIIAKYPQVVKVPKAGPMVIEHPDEEDEEIIEMDPSNDEKRKTNIRTNR